MIMPGYPHPECITGGWTALLSDAQKAIVAAKVTEKQSIDSGYYYSYTGFDALDDEAQAEIRYKLNENKQWERIHGTVWFKTPDPLNPKLKSLPNTADMAQKREWEGQYKMDAIHWLSSRRRQVKQMAVNDGYPVRTYIHRT
jgi:hypothetical protein